MAGSQPVGAYVKHRLFAEGAKPARRRVSADRALLAQLIGQLGASGLAASLGRMAEAADTGSLHVDELVTARLHSACDDIRQMRLALLTALGGGASQQSDLVARFHRAGSQMGDAP